MADEPIAPAAPVADPAAPAKVDVPPAKEPDPVPYARFKEVNDKAAENATKLAKYESEEAERKKQANIAAGNHQKVIDDLTPKAARAVELETALNTVIEAEIAAIPKDRQSLVPDLSPEKKLAWIAANRAILMGDKKGSVNHPLNPKDGTVEGGDKQTFTQAQIKDPKFYDEHRDAIMAAMRDGRITD